MSRDIAEIKEIRREKANLEKLIRSYQRRNEELQAKEAILIKKIETLEPGLINWKEVSTERLNSDGYIVGDPTFGFFKNVETPQKRMEKISMLREEVLQKQYENLKLEKELEARKEEHRQFHEMLTHRKTAVGQCVDGECSDKDEASQNTTQREDRGNAENDTETPEKKAEDEMKLWNEIGEKFDV